MAKDNIMNHDSALAYVEYVKVNKSRETWARYGEKWESEEDSKWHGGGYSKALSLAADGWAEGVEKLTRSIDVLRQQGRGRARVNGVGGDYPVIGRFLSGAPDYMSRRSFSDASRKPIVDIYVSPVVSCGGEPDKMILVGAAIVDFIDSAEAAGYSVNINVGMIAKGMQGQIIGDIFPLKRAGQALNLETLAYFIAHPSFLRRLGFKGWTVKAEYEHLTVCMGTPCIDEDRHKKFAEPGSLMFLPDADTINGFKTAADAKAWVLNAVKNQRPEMIEAMTEAA